MDSTTGQPSALLPPELLQHIFMHIPYERPTVRYRAKRAPRSFKPQLAFAHVCRAWRSAAFGSPHWPGVRLSLRNAERLKEGIEHDNGHALLHVHIDTKHIHTDIPPYRCQGCRPLPALEQLSRVRTLFLKADPEDHTGTTVSEDVRSYARVLEDRPAPELQDLTFEWQFNQRLALEFQHPFPRLRYLALLGCDLRSGPLILQTNDLVHVNFWDVSLFENIDSLVETFSGWQRLEHASITKCKIVSSSDGTKYARRTVYLPSLKDLTLSASTKGIGSFLTYIAFPPTSRAEIHTLSSTAEYTPIIADAIRSHFDSDEGRSVICNARSFDISYPNGFEIISAGSEVSTYKPFHDHDSSHGAKPEARFSFHQNELGSQALFFKAILERLPALETVEELNLTESQRPPAHVFNRFVGVTRLALPQQCDSLLKDITKDSDGTPLFPKLKWLELLGFIFHGQGMTDICELLRYVREVRPSLVKLVLRGCYFTIDEETEMLKGVFGKDNVEIEAIDNSL